MDCDPEYKVEHLQNDTWQVLEKAEEDDGDGYYWGMVVQGSLSDCEAWIRLKESGHLHG